MRSIPIDVMRAFVAVVEARGFTRAGEELGRSQPTVSLQVKRLEELMGAALFDKGARFELTPVGSVCFDYSKRLLRLHDDMLDEAGRRLSPDAALRVGLPGAFVSRLTPGAAGLREGGEANAFEIVADASDKLASAYRQGALDLAIVETEEEGAAARWRAPMAWYGSSRRQKYSPLMLVLPPPEDAAHRAAITALRAQGRKFATVCVSADFAALAASVAAGHGLAPMLEGVAPQGLRRSTDRGLPALPAVTISLLARSSDLASTGRRWIEKGVGKLEAL